MTHLILKKYEPIPWGFGCDKDKPATTPSEWFSKKFPKQAEIYGCPFIEAKQTHGMDYKIQPLAMNDDFFAAILGGDEKLGHKVVYLPGEMMFYFYDPKDKLFKPTTEEKLGNLLRGYLMKCAEELPDTVHKLGLFLQFRSEQQTKAIVNRAKSILAADHTFFENAANQRNDAAKNALALIRAFVAEHLKPGENKAVTLTLCFNKYQEFCLVKEHPALPRKQFRPLIVNSVHEAFGRGIRHDVLNDNGRHQSGWKGIGIDEGVVQASN